MPLCRCQQHKNLSLQLFQHVDQAVDATDRLGQSGGVQQPDKIAIFQHMNDECLKLGDINIENYVTAPMEVKALLEPEEFQTGILNCRSFIQGR